MSSPELKFAIISKLIGKGKRLAATLIDEILSTPEKAIEIKRACISHSKEPIKMTPNEDLAFMLDNDRHEKDFKRS